MYTHSMDTGSSGYLFHEIPGITFPLELRFVYELPYRSATAGLMKTGPSV